MEQTNSTNNNAFGGFPMDPNAMMKMMNDFYKKAYETMTSGNMGNIPMDPGAFMKTFEELLKRMNASMGEGSMPMDPSGLMKYFQETMGQMSEKGFAGMADPTQFFDTFNKMFAESPFGQMAQGQQGNMANMFDPSFWFRMGEKTFREGSNMMFGMGAQKPGEPHESTEPA